MKLQTCPNCGVRVLPTRHGACPSCQQPFAGAPVVSAAVPLVSIAAKPDVAADVNPFGSPTHANAMGMRENVMPSGIAHAVRQFFRLIGLCLVIGVALVTWLIIAMLFSPVIAAAFLFLFALFFIRRLMQQSDSISPETIAASARLCPSCGREVFATTVICPRCDTRLKPSR